MIRVAAIYDIHGNLPALEAVLDEVRQSDVDEVIVGGDVVPGPMPVETIALLRALDRPTHFIQGNGDREIVARRNGIESSAIPEQFRAAMRWVAEQLSAADAQLLASWPATLRRSVTGLGDVLFCHATPRTDTELFTARTAAARLRPAFEGVDAAVVVCGHTHMQFDRMLDSIRIVNAGSVGMPFGDAGACWALLGPDIELRRTAYDLASAAARIRGTGYPDAEGFAANNVLHPPAADVILDRFAAAELK